MTLLGAVLRRCEGLMETIMSQHAQQGVVELFDDYGNPTKYRKVSARLPEFLAKYPVDEYAVIITATDTLAAKPGLLALYEKCIENGKSFEEAGLPAYDAANSFLFTAKLIHNDRVVRQTSAVVRVAEYKDYEAGETAAFQRLLAQLGFSGEVFDDDEDNDFTKQSLTTDDVDDTGQQSDVEAQVQPSQTSLKTVAAEAGAIPSNLAAQIEHLANLKGLEVNPCNNEAEAKAELKRLQQA